MREIFLSLLTNAVNSGYDRGDRCLSAVFFALVNLLASTIFEIICIPFFFFYKVSSIYRQNWSCKEITSSQNSDKAASFSSVVVKLLRVCKHSATVDHFKIIHAVY